MRIFLKKMLVGIKTNKYNDRTNCLRPSDEAYIVGVFSVRFGSVLKVKIIRIVRQKSMRFDLVQ